MKRVIEPILSSCARALVVCLFVLVAFGIAALAITSMCGCATVAQQQQQTVCPIPGVYHVVATVEENTCPAGIAEVFAIDADFPITAEDACGRTSYELDAPDAGGCDLNIAVTIETTSDPSNPISGTEEVTLSNCRFPAVDCHIRFILLPVSQEMDE